MYNTEGRKEFLQITSVLNHPNEKKCRRESDLFDSQSQVKIHHSPLKGNQGSRNWSNSNLHHLKHRENEGILTCVQFICFFWKHSTWTKPKAWCHQQWMSLPALVSLIKTTPETGQRDRHSLSLRPFFQVTLGCVTLTIKTDDHMDETNHPTHSCCKLTYKENPACIFS